MDPAKVMVGVRQGTFGKVAKHAKVKTAVQFSMKTIFIDPEGAIRLSSQYTTPHLSYLPSQKNPCLKDRYTGTEFVTSTVECVSCQKR